jgi:hypothetical protein
LDVLIEARGAPSEARCEALLMTARANAEASAATLGHNLWLLGVEHLFSMLRQRETRWPDVEAHNQRAVDLLDDATRHVLALLARHAAVLPSILLAGPGASSARVRAAIDLLAEMQQQLVSSTEAAPAARPAWWASPSDTLVHRALPRVLSQVRACTALCDHAATQPNMLSFRAGESFAILSRHSSRFFKARHKRRVGLVPCALVRVDYGLDAAGTSTPSNNASNSSSPAFTPRSGVSDDWPLDPATSDSSNESR